MKSLIKIIVCSVIALLVGAAAGSVLFSSNMVEEKVVTVEKLVEVEVIVEKLVENEVLIDNENLALVLDFLHEKNGDIEYIVSDLKESEIEQIVDRIVFLNEAEVIAKNTVQDKLFNELLNTKIDGVKVKLSDLSRLRLNEDVTLIDIDFKNGDVNVIVSGSFEFDRVKYDFTADVSLRDNKFDEIVVNVLD
jgi:hypothetical protein